MWNNLSKYKNIIHNKCHKGSTSTTQSEEQSTVSQATQQLNCRLAPLWPPAHVSTRPKESSHRPIAPMPIPIWGQTTRTTYSPRDSQALGTNSVSQTAVTLQIRSFPYPMHTTVEATQTVELTIKRDLLEIRQRSLNAYLIIKPSYKINLQLTIHKCWAKPLQTVWDQHMAPLTTQAKQSQSRVIFTNLR